MPYIPEKNEECICLDDKGNKVWRCSTNSKKCHADMKNCNYPECDCLVPYYAMSHEKRVSFCRKKI